MHHSHLHFPLVATYLSGLWYCVMLSLLRYHPVIDLMMVLYCGMQLLSPPTHRIICSCFFYLRMLLLLQSHPVPDLFVVLSGRYLPPPASDQMVVLYWRVWFFLCPCPVTAQMEVIYCQMLHLYPLHLMNNWSLVLYWTILGLLHPR